MALLAVRFIDLAIFGSLGSLWLGGLVFIVLLYRWILRFDSGHGPTRPVGAEVQPVPAPVPRPRVRHQAVPQPATVREALAAQS